MNRVVITGIGAVSAYGTGADVLWDSLINGKIVIEELPDNKKLKSTDKGLYSPLPTLDYQRLGFSKMELMQYEESNLNMLVALEEALKGAMINTEKTSNKMNSVNITNINTENLGVYVGSGIGGVKSLLTNYNTLRALQNNGTGRLDAFTVSKAMPNNIAAAIGIKYNLHTNIHSYAYACATGTVTVGKAYNDIKNGLVDVAFTGSSEYLDDQFGGTYAAFAKAKTILLSGDKLSVNCPFDKKRSGFLFSDGGSAALVLESLDHAKQRGAHIIAEICGFSESFDAFNMVSGDPSGTYIQKMLNDLIDKADIKFDDVDYINTHGTGTIKNDEIEADIIEKLFGSKTALNSTKSLLGHTIAASGSIEAIVTALSIKNKMIHKNHGLTQPIKDLHFPTTTQKIDIQYAISTSYAFGGHNAALLFKRYTE